MPDRETYVNKEKGILAPHITPFPGLFEIYKKFPHLCFVFDHRSYDREARASLVEALRTGEIKGRATKFFVGGKTEVHPQNYPQVQRAIRAAVKETRLLPEHQEFERSYNLFLGLARLSSDVELSELQEDLRRRAHIIPPGWLGSFEQATYYQPPREGALRSLLSSLRRNPSLTRERLSLYEKKLKLITQYFNGEKKGPIELGFKGHPHKTRAHLEEDGKRHSPKGFTVSSAAASSSSSR